MKLGSLPNKKREFCAVLRKIPSSLFLFQLSSVKYRISTYGMVYDIIGSELASPVDSLTGK